MAMQERELYKSDLKAFRELLGFQKRVCDILEKMNILLQDSDIQKALHESRKIQLLYDAIEVKQSQISSEFKILDNSLRKEALKIDQKYHELHAMNERLLRAHLILYESAVLEFSDSVSLTTAQELGYDEDAKLKHDKVVSYMPPLALVEKA